MTNDPFDEYESPLWAFTSERTLNHLSLWTKLNISGVVTDSASAVAAPPAKYTAYASASAYNGNGCAVMDGGKAAIVSSVEKCTVGCDASKLCDCVTYCAEKSGDSYAKGACWRRTVCDPNKFKNDVATKPFTVYVKKSWILLPAPPPPPISANGAKRWRT